jgi:hypothetical protein
MDVLTIDKETNQVDVFNLPTGRLIIDVGFLVEVSFSREDLMTCCTLIKSKSDKPVTFSSQAGIIAYAGNNLGWGQGSGYKVV